MTDIPVSAEQSVTADDLRALHASCEAARDELGKTIVGQGEVINQLLISLLAGGHSLLVGVPGLAKTLLVRSIADIFGLTFNRIQFTPDLMPADITGTEVIQEDRMTGERVFRFVKGPVFSNVILADEINRTPPKTQAALLEAMQEKQVTIGGQRHLLPTPFFVLATQNPIEQEGTYPLPEAQLDRFMLEIRVDYPDPDDEYAIVMRSRQNGATGLSEVIDESSLLRHQRTVRAIPIAEHDVRYAIALVRATRIQKTDTIPKVNKYLTWGAGPRASEWLVAAAKASAALQGRDLATVRDVQHVAAPVLRHRLVTNFNAEADGVGPDDIVRTLIEAIPVPGDGRGRTLFQKFLNG